MIDMVDDFIGAHREVVAQLSEEPSCLPAIHMAEPADEIFLHEQDTLCDVLYIFVLDIRVRLLNS